MTNIGSGEPQRASRFKGALDLAARGFYVFPLKAGSKLPAIDRFTERATRDPEQIAAWWFDSVMGAETDYNIGISTSRFGDGGVSLLVLDEDNKNGKRGAESMLRLELSGIELPATAQASTPTTGKHHIYTTPVPVANSVDKLGDGLDVRGHGAYVVAAGSSVEAGTYTMNDAPVAEAPRELIVRCGFSKARQTLPAAALEGIDEERAAARFEEYLKTAPRSVRKAGGDTTAYNVACRGHDFGCSQATVLDLMLSERWDSGCGWTAEKLEKKVAHAFKYAKSVLGNAAPELEFKPITVPEGLPEPPIGSLDAKVKDLPASAVLIKIGQCAELVCDPTGEPYAVVDANGHRETHRIRGQEFANHLASEFYRVTQRGASKNAIADAVATLAAMARASGRTERVFLRVGEKDGRIYLDDGSPEYGCYEVTRDGWRHLATPPVLFRRPAKMAAYPIPTQPDFARLFHYVNVRHEDRVLVAAYILGSLNPRGPYPPLALSGEQGSAKSSSFRRIKALTDPSTSPLRSTPKDGVDLFVAANASWLLALDNASGISPQLSDDMCRLATGGSFAKRALYTDADEVQIELMRPIMYNGIDDGAVRPDLAERALHLEAPRVTTRRSESDLDAAFANDAGAIFAAVLNGLSIALRDYGTVDIGPLPRMADFAMWAAAGVPALGFTSDEFLAAYRRNQLDAVASGLDSSALARAVQDFANAVPDWRGSSSDLLQQLTVRVSDHERRMPSWPRSPKGLVNALRRLAPSLRHVGIEFDHGREAGGRYIELSVDRKDCR